MKTIILVAAGALLLSGAQACPGKEHELNHQGCDKNANVQVIQAQKADDSCDKNQARTVYVQGADQQQQQGCQQNMGSDQQITIVASGAQQNCESAPMMTSQNCGMQAVPVEAAGGCVEGGAVGYPVAAGYPLAAGGCVGAAYPVGGCGLGGYYGGLGGYYGGLGGYYGAYPGLYGAGYYGGYPGFYGGGLYGRGLWGRGRWGLGRGRWGLGRGRFGGGFHRGLGRGFGRGRFGGGFRRGLGRGIGRGVGRRFGRV